MVEIYNPNPWITFGGMGSKKLIGENIEYIANYDSHPRAQFNSEFRSLVKSETASLLPMFHRKLRKLSHRGQTNLHSCRSREQSLQRRN